MQHPILTHENIRIAISVLSALDDLQEKSWIDHEREIRKANPHSDSEMLELASRTLKAFTLCSMGGNAQGMRMLSSAFVQGLQLVGLNDEVDIALQTVKAPDHE